MYESQEQVIITRTGTQMRSPSTGRFCGVNTGVYQNVRNMQPRLGVIHPMRLRFAIPIALGFALTVRAQTQKFEVATIKPCKPGLTMGINPTPGRVSVNCMNLMLLIRQAYVTFANGRLNPPGRNVPIEKAPAWIESTFYTIEAKAEGAPAYGMTMGPMMQALLEDRFHLKIQRETREVPVYALTVAKGGPKLIAAPPGSCAVIDIDRPAAPLPPAQPVPAVCKFARVTGRGFDVHGVTMPEFADVLAGRLDRDVIDKTGIPGLFDFEVVLFPGASVATLGPPPGGLGPPAAPAPPPPPDPSGLTDFGGPFAAAQAALQKFGLRLESARGPSRFFVIDSIERPSEN